MRKILMFNAYNLIEYSDNYSKTFRGLYLFWKDEPHDNLTECDSFKFESRLIIKLKMQVL